MIIVKPEKAKIEQDGSEIQVVKQNIWITKGDSGYLTLDIIPTDKYGDVYELTEDDVISVQVRKAPNGGDIVFTAEIVRDDEIFWHIRPEDTTGQSVGTYVWDGQVVLANGDVFSFVPVSDFHIIDEVTE